MTGPRFIANATDPRPKATGKKKPMTDVEIIIDAATSGWYWVPEDTDTRLMMTLDRTGGISHAHAKKEALAYLDEMIEGCQKTRTEIASRTLQDDLRLRGSSHALAERIKDRLAAKKLQP